MPTDTDEIRVTFAMIELALDKRDRRIAELEQQNEDLRVQLARATGAAVLIGDDRMSER